MRIRRVTAHAFGHLRDESLELADGLTVIYGPNESGKSTWHAALLAALCGRWPNPRAKGEPGIERRRPWSGRDWSVSAELGLADGRRVELRQDLEARLGTAIDLDLGRNVAPEIAAKGGVPDASRWLGLDRTAFVAAACVRQSHLALAVEDANGIRAYVESAASTASADETAAQALARLDAFRREQVGTERSTTKPLPVAERELAEAEAALRAARDRQAETDRRAAAARELRAAADTARLRLARHEAAQAWAEATRLGQRAAEAGHLADIVAAGADAAVGVGSALRELGAGVAAAGGGASRGAGGVAVTEAVTVTEVKATEVMATEVTATEVTATEVAAAIATWRAVPRSLPQPSGPPHPRSGVDDEPVPGPGAAARARRRAGTLLGVAGLLGLAAVAGFVAGWAVAGGLLAVLGVVLAAIGLVGWGRASAAPAPPAGGAEDGWRREWAQARDEASAVVLAVAGRLGVPAGSPEEAVTVLGAWLAEDEARQSARDDATARRERLRALLDGGTLASVRESAERARQRAQAATEEVESAARAAQASLGAVHSGAEESGPAGSTLDADELRRNHREAERSATVAEQALATLVAGPELPVAEAEERLAAAQSQVTRLRDLDDVLDRTRQFLQRAQERAHRDIAPTLAGALARDLATVTAGRYTGAVVDPDTLRVRVRGSGDWRDVDTLSGGTAEQVYLLLRVALAERLVTGGESCPLLLDDVTVHADEGRTERILAVLLAIAQRHQVVLFTQQEQVRRWAQATVDGNRHALRELTALAPA